MNTSVGNLVSESQYAVTKQAGFGGPDLSSPTCYQSGCSSQTEQLGPTFGEQIFSGLGSTGNPTSQNFGTTNYRGMIPAAYQQQQGAYIAGTSGSVYESSAWNLQLTHVIWENDSGNSNAITTWAQVTSALQSNNFRIHSSCPTAYTNGCNTN